MKVRKIALMSFTLAVLILIGAGIAYLRSARFQERARTMILQRIEQATGLRAAMDRFSLDIFRGRFALAGLDLRSRGESRNRFALTIGEASGAIRLSALWRPKVELGELNLVRPRITIQQQPGGSPWSLEPIMRKSLAVAARKATIREGWVELNNRRIPLNLAVEALDCSIRYWPSPQSYIVNLEYKNSRLEWGKRNFTYDLSAQISVLPTGLEIESFALREDKSSFSGIGRLDNWNAPVLQVHAAGTVAGDNLTLLTPDLKDAGGDVGAVGDLRWDARGVQVTGRFIAETARYRQTVAHSLRGLFEIKNDVLFLRDVSGRMGSGSFRIDGSVQLRASNKALHHLKIAAKNVELRNASGILDLRALALENSVDADVTLDWRHGLEDLQAQGAVNLRAVETGASDSGMSTALQGTTEFAYRNRAWSVNKASLASPDTRIEAVGLDPERARIRLDTDRPSEVFRIIRSFSSSLETLLETRPDVIEISGRYHLDGEVRLRPGEAMTYEGQIAVTGGRWRTYGFDSMSAHASWNGSRLKLRALKLQAGVQSADGDFVLDLPLQDAVPDLAFDGTLRQLSLAWLRDQGVDLQAPVAGVMSGKGRVAYEQGRLQGIGQFQVEKGNIDGKAFDLLQASLQVTGRELRIMEGQVTRGSASVSARGQVNLDTMEMNLSARLQEIPLLDIPEVKAGGLAVDGRMTAAGEIRGTPDRPEITANVDLEGLRYAGWNLGTGKATVTIRDRMLSANIDVKSEFGGFQGEAHLATDRGYPGSARLAFRDWNVKRIIVANAPQLLNDFSTALHGNLSIEGPFAEPAKLRIRGELDGASFKLHGYELRNDGMMRFTAQNQKLTVEEARLVGDRSSLSLGGEIPLASDGELKLQLKGRLDLGFLDHLAPKLGVSGAAILNINSSGPFAAPNIIGQAALEDTRVDHEDLPYPVSALRGNIIFSRNSVKLESVTGAIASGTIQLTGSVEHQNAELRGINLQASIRSARLRYPTDFLSTVNAELNLRGGRDTQVLTGEVSVLRADYLKDFSVLQQLIGRPAGPPAPQITDSLLAGMRLNISVRSADGVYIDNELTRVQAGMNLMLRGTLAYPSVTGGVKATEGAIFFRGNRFDIVNASANFIDRNRINPVFDVSAEAEVHSYRLRLEVAGDLDRLRFNISSDPPLSTVEILSLLTTGKSDELGVENPRRQAEITGLSAASILSEGLTGVIGKRVERIFGLQSFRVDPFLAGAGNDPTARVTISERLSKDLALTFSRNLSTNEEQIVVLEYDVNRNLSIVATRDEKGMYSVDFRFRKRFR